MEKYVLGVKINTGYNVETAVERVAGMFDEPGTHYISTTNPEFIVDAQKDPDFKKIINNSDLSVPDGSGILYALYFNKLCEEAEPRDSKIHMLKGIRSFVTGVGFGVSSLYKRYPLGDKVTGVELMDKMCEYAARNGKTVFLLGGSYKDKWGNSVNVDEDMATNVGNILQNKYPGLRVVGASSSFKSDVSDDGKTLDFIHDSMKRYGIDSLDFLFVAYGHPKQEKWIYRNKDKIPAKVCMGVGGTFDYISGSKERCPERLRYLNLEWLYKLVTQPWRIKRIIKAFPIFPYFVYIDSIKHR